MLQEGNIINSIVFLNVCPFAFFIKKIALIFMLILFSFRRSFDGDLPDMKFVQNFTPPDFQVKNFTPSISPNFNSFSKKKHKKIVKMEKFTPLATNFTLPPGLTGWTNFTSGPMKN